MTTNFFAAITTKKSGSRNNLKLSKLSKRTLGLESLESREMLSVNPLGIDNYYISPDFVQTATVSQNFQTEADPGIIDEDSSETTYTSVKFSIAFTDLDNLVAEEHLTDVKTYTLQYRNITGGTWTSSGKTVKIDELASETSTPNLEDVVLTNLVAGATYELRLNDLGTNTGKETDETSTLGKTAYDIGTIATADPDSAKLVKAYYDGSDLELILSGIPESYEDTDIAVTGTYGPTGTGTNITSPTVSPGGSGEFTITINGPAEGDKVIITDIKINTSDATLFANKEFLAISGPPPATTNSTSSASGATSSAVTLTWTKPTKAQSNASGNPLIDVALPRYVKTDLATDYKITVSNDAGFEKEYYSQNKTTLVITGLPDSGAEYSYKVESKLTPKVTSNILVKDSTTGYVVVTSGTFNTEATTLADQMAVGRPTDVKTTPTDSSVKITWKAPVNYTGGYEVKITDITTLASTFSERFKVAAGAKTELTVNIGSGTNNLTSGNRYEVVITPISGNNNSVSGSNGLASTPTNFVAKKTQSDPTVTTPTTSVPANAPAADLVTISVGDKPQTVKVKLATGKTIPADVDGYWVQLADTSVPSAISASSVDPAAEGFVYITKAQLTAGVDIIATGLTDVAARIHASNSTGFEANGEGYTSAVTPVTAGTLFPGTVSAKSVSGAVSGSKITVTWTNNNENFNTSSSGYFATKYDVYMSQSNSGPWVYVDSVAATATTNDSALKLDITNLKYNTDYYFRVIATCNNAESSGEKVAAVTDSAKVAVGSAPAVEAKNILSARSVAKDVQYADNKVTFTLTANTASGTKVAAEQYYVVLRDANKAIIAHDFLPSSTTAATLTLDSALTPKAKYTVEVYGVVGTTIGTTKVTGTLSVADYPAATLKVTSSKKPTINGVSITVTDKTTAADKFYYVQYTSVADAKSKPDWSTATVEKLDAANVTASGSTAYELKKKLDPNTQYYVRIVTSDTNVTIDNGGWKTGNGDLDDWNDATKVVFGKEIKIKTAAVPLATVGKPAFGFDKDFNMTLKTVGQTMLSAKGADDLFGSGKPLNGADFAYKLLVSQDSKVDKVTGKLLGSAEIPLTIDSGSGGSIKIETLPAKGSVGAVSSGQYTLEYALTGEGGILEELKVSAANISSLKNLNFQLVTVVKYNGVSFDSVTKPGKVAMPKWFV